MNESKHTKGPWKVAPNATGLDVKSAKDQRIASVLGLPSMETSANARLIAAAPDLYDALEALIDAAIEATSEDGDVSDIDGSLIDAARAAIAKATGEQQCL